MRHKIEIEDGFHKTTKNDETIVEANYMDGMEQGMYEAKFKGGKILKGHMENGSRHGIWEGYFPAQNESPGYWIKQNYQNGKKVGDRYDIRYDD